ncbi:60s ribosomal protein l12-3 [Quercus suber]|uniref:60s ribosomal protein l12-3 n=1 Tax=Quercus suber TaxID=58331 RepID=A0AAW0IS65_QUESU
MVPSVVALVIKALKEPERDRKKMKNIKHNGNISLDDVVETAKVTCPRSMAKDLNGTVKRFLARAEVTLEDSSICKHLGLSRPQLHQYLLQPSKKLYLLHPYFFLALN